MLNRLTEYLAYGVGRPMGVLWATEKAYFDFRRRFPGKEEQIYLRLAFQSRYPEKDSDEVIALVSGCHNLEDIMVKALSIDFSPGIAAATRINVLMNLPLCARCGKYKALSTIDNLCYGCRKYPGFSACTRCHLYWDDSPNFCERCGGKLWQLRDGPGVPVFSSETNNEQPFPAGGSKQNSIHTEELAGQEENEGSQFLNLAMQAELLEQRCSKVWSERIAERRNYRAMRRIDPLATHDVVLDKAKAQPVDESLVADLDSYFDALCDFYLSAPNRDRADILVIIGSSKRLAGNLHNYAGRTASRLKENGDAKFLLRGLAATSIDCGRTGQDFSYILESLWKSAAFHGIDRGSAFATVAKMSECDLLQTFPNSRA